LEGWWFGEASASYFVRCGKIKKVSQDRFGSDEASLRIGFQAGEWLTAGELPVGKKTIIKLHNSVRLGTL
jgi:hypothetical protein